MEELKNESLVSYVPGVTSAKVNLFGREQHGNMEGVEIPE